MYRSIPFPKMNHRFSFLSQGKNSADNPIITMLSSFCGKRAQIEIPELQINNWTMPILDRGQINEVKARIHEGKSITDAMTKIHTYFSFSSDILLSILNFLQEEHFESKEIYLAACSHIVYWLSCTDLTPILNHFVLLVQVILCLNDLIKPEMFIFSLNSVIYHYFLIGHMTFPSSLINVVFEKANPVLLDTAAMVISNLLKNKMIDDTHYLIDILTTQISRDPNNYENISYEQIVNTLMQTFVQYDLNTLGLFAALASVKDDATLNAAFFSMPRVFKAHFVKIPVETPPIEIPKIDESDSFEIDSAPEKCRNKSCDHNHSLPSDLNPPPIADFQSSMDYEDLLCNDKIYSLKVLFSLLSRVLPQYVFSFFQGFIEVNQESKNEPYSLEFFISFLYSLDRIQNVEITDEIFYEIINQTVFLPGISIFKPCKNFEIIAFIRKCILLIFAKHRPKYVGTLLQGIETHPFLFADVIGRIHVNLDKFDLDSLTDEGILGAIIHVISNLSVLSSCCDNETLENISQARSTILIFLFSILENASVAARCFSSSVFTSGFLARIFDPYFHRPVIIVLRQFLTKTKSEEKGVLFPTIEYICGIIDACSSMNDNENPESVAIDLLVTVNESIAHNRTMPLKFESLINAATHYLAVHSSIKFLDQTLQLYSQMLLTSPHYSVSNKQIQQLSIAIRKSDGIKPSEATVCGLIGMIARSRSLSVNASFFVQEPKLLLLLLSTIQTKDDTMKYISLILQLCQHSAYNCTQSHKGELDLLLLELIKNYPNSFYFHGCRFDLEISEGDIVKYVLPLLTTIAIYESSPQFCTGLISLMAPNGDPPVFPRFASEIMEQFSGSITHLAQDPAVSLPIGLDDRLFIFEGLKTQDLEYGFTFQFLLFADVHAAMISNRRPMIIQISDEGKTQIQLYVQGSSIVCRVNSPKGSAFAALHSNYPSCSWAKVTLLLQQFKDDTSAISFSLNNSTASTFNLDLPTLVDGSLVVQIGGLAEQPCGSGEPIDPLCLIGAFRFYNEAFEKTDFDELSELGTRKSDGSRCPLFCYPSIINSSNPSQRQITLTKTGKDFPVYDNIIDNLKKSHVLKIITPLFLYFPVMPPHFAEFLCDILLCVVSSEDQFPYFPLIGGILAEQPSNCLTYSLYIKFFTFAENVTDSSLVKSLIIHILMNFDIWSISESSHFIRILAHWVQNLYPSCHTIVHQCFEFSHLLALSRIYLWYKPIEIELIKHGPSSERRRDDNIDIEACRQNFNKLLLAFASHKFTANDARTIISHCAVCPDQPQVFSLLSLFLEIVKRNRLTITMPVAVCRLTYHQFKPQNELRFEIAYKVLYSMADPKYLQNYTDAIIALMNDMFYTEELFERCIDMLPDYPCAYTLCTSVAMNMTNGHAAKMAKALSELNINIQIATLFKHNPNWCAWPIALLSRLEKSQYEYVITFLLNIFYADVSLDIIDNIINTFDLFASVMNSDFEENARTLFTKIASNFVDSDNREFTLGILLRCIKMMLLRVNDSKNNALRMAFNDSTFDIPESSWKGYENANHFTSLKQIINEITANPNRSNYQFGLVLNADGKPLYDELFRVTAEYSNRISSPHSAVVFWNQTFDLLLKRTMPEEEKCFNLINKCLAYSIKITYGNKKRNMSIFQSIRKSIIESEIDSKTSLQSIDTNEIAIASLHIDIAHQTCMDRVFKYSKDLRYLLKTSMQEDSPWNDQRYRQTNFYHSSTSDSSYNQPFLKRKFSIPLTAAPPILPVLPRFAYRCLQIKFDKEIPANFQIFQQHIELTKATSTKIIKFCNIKRIFMRWRFHRSNALEIFMKDGDSAYVDFTPIEAQTVISNFSKINPQLVQTVAPQVFFAANDFTKQWCKGNLTNFEYLMVLNQFSGRTFNDPTMYPIMPWVISDYTTQKIKYRDLSKPIAVQNGEQTRIYFMAPNSPTSLSYFLYRIEPFKSIPKDRKIEKLRLTKGPFISLQESYKAATAADNTNCWELTPEFFSAPHFFDSDDFTLPSWANSSAEEFIYLHRKALESPDVSEHLNDWIDLVFGVNSRKKKALNAENVFNSILFPESADLTDTKTLENNLRRIGHMPALLFNRPHPLKEMVSRNPTFHTAFTVPLERSDIISATIFDTSYGAINFIAFCKDGTVLSVRADFVSQLNRVTLNIGNLPSDMISSRYERGCIAVDNKKHLLYLIKERAINKFDINIRNVNCIVSSEEMIAVTSSNGEVIGWNNYDFKEQLDLCFVSLDYVTTLAMSTKFGMIACGTSNAKLIVYSYNTGQFLFLVKLPAEPEKVLITPEHGFIVVESGQELFLISITGKIIRKTRCDFGIDKWTTWSCERGIDFIAISDGKNQVRMSEAFYLNFDSIFYQSKAKILEMKFIVPTRGIAIISADGFARLIPKALPF